MGSSPERSPTVDGPPAPEYPQPTQQQPIAFGGKIAGTPQVVPPMRTRSLGFVTVVIGLVTAACNSTAGEQADTTVATSAAAPSASTTSQAPAVTSSAPSVTAPMSPEVTVPDEWSLTEIARGVKPDLAFDAGGSPAVAFLLEDRDGFIAFADAGSGWTEERVADGYFYGPIGLAYDPDGNAIIAYHDHQDVEFNMDLGDLVVATRSDTGWTNSAAADDGHDGWDSTVAVAADGTVHAAGIDPQQFDREDGVQHYQLKGNRGTVTPIGSGPIQYEWNVSLAMKPDGNPAITYFDNNTQDLMYAERVNTTWSIETVVAAGDVGRFSSLAIDDAGTPHISFYENSDETSGIVRYATRAGGSWVTEQVGVLDDVVMAFTGARRTTSLDLHPNGAPVVAFSDRSGVYLATRRSSGWVTTTVATEEDFAPGQMVDLGIDDSGAPHLVTYAVTNESPLDGVIVYMTGAS